MVYVRKALKGRKVSYLNKRLFAFSEKKSTKIFLACLAAFSSSSPASPSPWNRAAAAAVAAAALRRGSVFCRGRDGGPAGRSPSEALQEQFEFHCFTYPRFAAIVKKPLFEILCVYLGMLRSTSVACSWPPPPPLRSGGGCAFGPRLKQ